MARMIPGVLPEFEGQSAAERHLYDEFRRQLPAEYIVFYGVRFLANRQRSFSTDREIDFLIVHPERAGVVVEVKGGGIEYNSEYDVWASVDRYGNLHPISNPFAQARTNLYDLMAELGRHEQTRAFRYTFNWQVCLPSISGAGNRLGIEAPPETVIDSSDLHDLQTAIERAARPLTAEHRLSNPAIRALVDSIAPSVAAPPDGLGYHLLTAERNLIELTTAQTRLLDYLDHQPRAGIAGCCGSGKTMLALEKTRRLASDGRRVLLTCFNAHLARWLQAQLEQDGFTLGDDLLCLHYHDVVRHICAQKGVDLPSEPTDSNEIPAYYEETFPDCLDQAIGLMADDDRFDAVIVDEGQDFSELWWTTLDALLKEPQQGTLYIFYDNNQRIYGQTGEMPVPDNAFPLNRNCRNTDQIHAMVRPYFQGDGVFEPGGVDGQEPELVTVTSQDGVAELRATLHRLINLEGIPAGDIAVLSAVTERGGSALHDGKKIGNITLRRTHDEVQRGEVRLSTIHSFKGLESPIVIITELDRLSGRSANLRQLLLYVGLSRARSHLIVIGDLPEG